MTVLRVLTLPGWLDSGPAHWQSLWEQQYGHTRVEQADWRWPRRGDWMARLDEVILAEEGEGLPAVLVADGLGCHLVAAWAAHSQHTARVCAALLVAPPDTERAETPPQLFGWRPIVRQPLPFAAQVLYSEDDPTCTVPRALAFAAAWGASAHSVGRAGHINGDSGLADWPAGLARLERLKRLMDEGQRR
jgi:uncharacterized protein